MRVTAEVEIVAPRERVWAAITDPSRALAIMSGMTRWQVISEQDRGLGTRIRILMQVGSAEVGSLIEVVEYDEPRDVAWTSLTGVDMRGRWRLRESIGRGGGPRTKVELRLAYGVAGGGLAGWAAERLAAPQVRGHLRRSVTQLKREVEHEQLRAAAEARRAARAAAAAG